jgi:nucleoside-diphosphate-sugar epimerase
VPTIHGDGEQTRDFTYVANIVDGVLLAAKAPKASGEVINVATGRQISINELARTLGKVIGNTKPPCTSSRVPATSATRWPTSPRHGRCWATNRPWISRKACARLSIGTGRLDSRRA